MYCNMYSRKLLTRDLQKLKYKGGGKGGKGTAELFEISKVYDIGLQRCRD